MSVLKRLWRGELSLPITFWLFGVGGLFLLSLPVIVLDQIYPDSDEMSWLAARLYLISFFFAIIYFIFIFVANWRSAWKHRGQLLKLLWRGELSLAVTYWGFGWMGSYVVSIPFLILEHIYPDPTVAPVIAGFLLVIFSLFGVMYIGTMSVAIFRSAGNYLGWEIWATLARMSVLFVVVFGLILFAR